MESNNQLKNRFEKLQKESSAQSEEAVPTPTKSRVEETRIALQASSRPDIHEKVRTAPRKSYDWKKQFKKLFVKPRVETGRSTQMTDVEWNLQSLAQNSIIISFTHSADLDQNLERLSQHIKKRQLFWTKVLKNAEHFHIYAEKNKTHLGIRYGSTTASVKNGLKYALEEEYLSGANTIKTFYMKGQNDWIEIILEISNATEVRKRGEANQ